MGIMRTSPEEYGNYIEKIEKPHFTKEQKQKFGHGVMNCHHLFWIAKNHQDWTRQEPDFLPQMYKDAHNALHAECLSVPEVSKDILRIVRADFTPTGNTLESLDQVLLLIDHASRMEQVHPIDKQLAQLSIHALEMQIPYLRGNIMPHNYKDINAIAMKNYNDYIRGYQ